jgi:hypothetical protein
MKKINISTKRYPNTFVTVDDEVFEWLNQFKWFKSINGYAVSRKNQKNKTILMHRLINDTPI